MGFELSSQTHTFDRIFYKIKYILLNNKPAFSQTINNLKKKKYNFDVDKLKKL